MTHCEFGIALASLDSSRPLIAFMCFYLRRAVENAYGYRTVSVTSYLFFNSFHAILSLSKDPDDPNDAHLCWIYGAILCIIIKVEKNSWYLPLFPC